MDKSKSQTDDKSKPTEMQDKGISEKASKPNQGKTEFVKQKSSITSSSYNKTFSLQSALDSRSKPGEYDHFKPQLGDFFCDVNEIRNNCKLFPCETLIKSERVSYSSYLLNWVGVFVITDFRIVFCFKDEKKLAKMKFHPDYFNIPLFQIEKVNQLQDKEKTASCPLEITLKDSRVLNFYLWEKDSTIIDLLKKNCFPKETEMLYNFTSCYNEYINKNSSPYINGWDLYDPIKEFQRQGVLESNDLNLRYCKANEGFKHFPTYPEFLVVHKEMNDNQLVEASKHRTKNRLPAVSFFYGKNAKNEKTKAAIWRSSQTKSGIMGSKNSMDVILLNKISTLCGKLIIFDARPYLNAVANKANGGGFENVDHYKDTEIVFCDIDNIHAVRNSLNKLQQICSSPKVKINHKFYSSIEETKWYFFIHLLLKYSYQITKRLRRNCSVLIHCSDGWDRTSQLVSISQLLLDPYYRTIKGFGVLIEKDWLSFGHQFGIRNGIYFKEPKEDQRSPIFLQFLDCIHQLLVQFPNVFEFNDDLLVFLANAYNSNQYGSFMFNSENERKSKQTKAKTTSVWTDVLVNVSHYKNAFYQSTGIVERLRPDYSPSRISPWFEFFMKYNYTIKPLSVYYPDEKLKKVFKTESEFYMYNKEKDELKYNSLEKKYSTLKEFVSKMKKEIAEDEKLKPLKEEADQLLQTMSNDEIKQSEEVIEETSSSEEEKRKEEGDEDLELYLN